MGKITQVSNGDTGLQARTNLNEAMKTVEHDATMSGDGTAASPLTVAVGWVFPTLAVATNKVDLDFENNVFLLASNRVEITAAATISVLQPPAVGVATFKVEITNLAPLTFGTGSVSPDPNWVTLVWTPPSDGKFSISIYKTGTEYEVIFTQIEAV